MFLDQASFFFQRSHEISPWNNTQSVCKWTLTKYGKASVAPAVILQEFYKLRHKSSDCTEIYTDGSKAASFAGCAAFSKIFTSV